MFNSGSRGIERQGEKIVMEGKGRRSPPSPIISESF
jgi:hypothetical protein